MLENRTNLNPLRSVADGPSSWSEVQSALSLAKITVLEIFASEEQNGHLAEALNASPERDREATELRQQHDELSQSLTEITSHAKREGDLEHITKQVRQWLEEFDKHERRERALVQEAFMTDLGSGD